MTAYDTGECKGRLSNPPYREISKMIDYLQQNPLKNSRTSSFKEEAPDVAQNIAQELSFYCYGQILIGGPLKAFWALGESRGPNTSVRKSPWDQKYL